MKTTKIRTDERVNEVINHAIDGLANITEDNTYGCDLHNELFNRDYFIIGYYNAEQFLKKGDGIFNALEEIKEYEEGNFGEITTDLTSSEKVANMYAYIKGEEILSESKILRDNYDNRLTKEDLEAIKEELENFMKG